MNQEIKARWTAALRSGDYEQGQSYLNRHGQLCCLGVLCELAAADGIITAIRPGMPGYDKDLREGQVDYGQDGNETLPDTVLVWAGLAEGDPVVGREGFEDARTAYAVPSLASFNDAGTPFAVIADIIDAKL